MMKKQILIFVGCIALSIVLLSINGSDVSRSIHSGKSFGHSTSKTPSLFKPIKASQITQKPLYAKKTASSKGLLYPKANHRGKQAVKLTGKRGGQRWHKGHGWDNHEGHWFENVWWFWRDGSWWSCVPTWSWWYGSYGCTFNGTWIKVNMDFKGIVQTK